MDTAIINNATEAYAAAEAAYATATAAEAYAKVFANETIAYNIPDTTCATYEAAIVAYEAAIVAAAAYATAAEAYAKIVAVMGASISINTARGINHEI